MTMCNIYYLCPGGSLSRGSLPRGSLSRGLCPRRWLSRRVFVQGGLCSGGSLFKGGLCPGVVSVQGSLCPWVVSVQEALSRGSLSMGLSLSRGISVQGLSLFRGMSLSKEGLCHGDPPTVMSRRYASFWNAFFFSLNLSLPLTKPMNITVIDTKTNSCRICDAQTTFISQIYNNLV